MKDLAEDPEDFRDKFEDKTDRMADMAKQFMDYMKQYPKIAEGLQFMEGLVRNMGVHAAAVVITEKPITDYIPVYKQKNGKMPVTAFAMKEIDKDLHMLKLDALSLSNLTTIQKITDLIRQDEPDFNIRKVSIDDEDTFETLRHAHTVGVFQLNGGGITKYTKQVKPHEFDNITDIAALYRPGPLKGQVDDGMTMTEKYVENYDEMKLDEWLETIPDKLVPIYENTRGVLVYQEQIMNIAQTMAGYTLGGADLLRRAIGKKDANLMEALSSEFIYGTEKAIPMLEKEIEKLQSMDGNYEKKIKAFEEHLGTMRKLEKSVPGSINRGFDEKYTKQTFDAIAKFAEYSFNRSHSAAYAMIGYWTAYLKTHYPVEFMTGLLTVEASDADKLIRNINECRRLNIQILPPDINRSDLGFSIERSIQIRNGKGVVDENGDPIYEKAIRFGLEAIKGVGPKVIKEIMAKPASKEDIEEEIKAITSDEINHRALQLEREGYDKSANLMHVAKVQLEEEAIQQANGKPYQSFDDFFNRVDKRIVNKGYIEKLIRAGCFDFDEPNRHTMMNHFYFELRKDKEFLGTEEDYLKAKKKKKVTANDSYRLHPKDYDEQKICEYEEELYGFYLTHHPYADLPYENWEEVRIGEPVDMGGKITKSKVIKTRKGDQMAFLEVDTAGGKIDITAFPKIYEKFKSELFKDNIAVFNGKKETNWKDADKTDLILDKVKKVRKKKFRVEKQKEAGLDIRGLDGQTIYQPEEVEKSKPKENPLGDMMEDKKEKQKDELADLAALFK